MDSLWLAIEQTISAESGQRQTIRDKRAAGGGCINQSFVVSTDHNRWFVKLNAVSLVNMFEAEAEALSALQTTQSVRIPTPLSTGQHDDHGFLILECLDMNHPVHPGQFGAAMAHLHAPQADATFGWHRHNTIGTTPQINTHDDSWANFFARHRLGFQVDLAARNAAPAHLIDSVQRLSENLALFFKTYDPAPALLHGDLWSGNWGALEDGTPVIFDPASYVGDHEADLAMMELFGHPGQGFFNSYQEIRPIDAGYKVRKVLYNLYHILNHFNLFGAGYASQAQAMTDRLLAEIK